MLKIINTNHQTKVTKRLATPAKTIHDIGVHQSSENKLLSKPFSKFSKKTKNRHKSDQQKLKSLTNKKTKQLFPKNNPQKTNRLLESLSQVPVYDVPFFYKNTN